MADIGARDAQLHTDRAVRDRQMSLEEADGYLDRVRGGEHSRELHSAIKRRPAGG